MNDRLQLQYLSIEEQNKQKFLDNQIEVDATWGKPIWGVTFQIDLAPLVKDRLCQYQSELDKLEPHNLLLLPRPYQHISFNQVVFWGGQYELGTEGTWDKVKDNFLSEFVKLDHTFSSFDLSFSKLIATTGGIIWVAIDENDELETLRGQFLQKLPFPSETTKLNHIIHTTVARYQSKLNSPEKVLSYIDSNKEEITMKVTRISLKKELVFPSIKTEEIASINLT